MLQVKNRNKETPSFANINMLGLCNIHCYFCLGEDIPDHFGDKNCLATNFAHWDNFDKFLVLCQENGIKKLYLTGQNTDPTLYHYLRELVDFLQDAGFDVGIRTNGYEAIGCLDIINSCREEIGYTINSLDYNINHKITGKYELPDWTYIIPRTTAPCRVSFVINRYNFIELMSMIKFVSQFENVRYIQLRRACTDTREEFLKPDMEIFDRVFESFQMNFGHQHKGEFKRAERFELFGKEITFWRTINTSVNSFNYFTDGTISTEYFIIEGYLKENGLKVQS